MGGRHLQSSTASWSEPIRFRFPAALLRDGGFAMGNWKAGAYLEMLYSAREYGRSAGVLALLGAGGAKELRSPPNVSPHARHRAHENLGGF